MKLYRPTMVHTLKLSADAADGRPSDAMLAKINALPGVLKTLGPDDVIVRRAVIANDRVLRHSPRRLRTSLIQQMADAAPGVPVTDDHAETKFDAIALPCATTIDGEVIPNAQKGGNDLVVNYYSMRTPPGLERDTQIMGGIIKENSISAATRDLKCSICDDNAGDCEHVPGAEYGGQTALWEFDNLEEFRAWSPVYAGEARGTHFLAARSGDAELIDDAALEVVLRERAADPMTRFWEGRHPGAWEQMFET